MCAALQCELVKAGTLITGTFIVHFKSIVSIVVLVLRNTWACAPATIQQINKYYLYKDALVA